MSNWENWAHMIVVTIYKQFMSCNHVTLFTTSAKVVFFYNFKSMHSVILKVSKGCFILSSHTGRHDKNDSAKCSSRMRMKDTKENNTFLQNCIQWERKSFHILKIEAVTLILVQTVNLLCGR